MEVKRKIKEKYNGGLKERWQSNMVVKFILRFISNIIINMRVIFFFNFLIYVLGILELFVLIFWKRGKEFSWEILFLLI